MADNKRIDSRRMGEMEEGKLLLSLAMPIMLSMRLWRFRRRTS